jgi:hypothetical protein
MFARYDSQGNLIRYKDAVIDCSEDEVITEQHHKKEVDINNIVKRHGVDLIAEAAAMSALKFDDVTGNDFQEAMFKIAKAKESFDKIPADIREKFNYDAAKFLDWAQNPANRTEMVQLGLAEQVPGDPPVQVEIVNPETPPADTAGDQTA